jgi:phage terminase large subunit
VIQFPKKLQCLFRPKRLKVLHGGRGSGKSWAVARALLIQGAQRPLRILCAREVQKSIKDSVHRLLTDQIQALGLGEFYEVLDTEIRGRNGSLFLFAGLAQHTVESIKSFEGVDVVWVEEAQVVTKRSWDVLTPTIRKEDKAAGTQSEIWITLNPDMETDETYKRFVEHRPEESPEAFVIQVNWRDNPWFPSVLEAERLQTQQRDPQNYANIWEGEPKRVSDGAIYRYEIEALYRDSRARNVPYDTLLRVHTVWDLGWNDAMTIGFWQRSGSEVRCIDYIEDSHRTIDWYVGQIEKRAYRWGTDFIPHDGRARNIQTGKSTEEALQAMGRNVVVLPALDIEEGIKAARLMFPRVYIDQTAREVQTGFSGPARLLECLKRYQRQVNQRTMEATIPLHDEYSHGADMFRYAGMAVDQMGNATASQPIRYKSRILA